MELIEKDEERLKNELLKRISDEAKIFHNFNSVQSQRFKCATILSLFEN